jgi:KDO2-lipid IV(A) lauroyltransferase
MQFILYLLVYSILFISILPFRLLYLLSDAVFFNFYVARYRRKVVSDNIVLALPHLSKKEQMIIEKKSYQHLCDMFLEMIKTLSISRKRWRNVLFVKI